MKQTASQGKSVAIVTGFAEGWLTGRRMRKELAKRGFSNTKDVANADVLIAHSGGCFIIPVYATAKLIVCINPPHWPGKPMTTSGVEKLKIGYASSKANKALHRFFAQQLRNFLYLWNVPRYRKMWKGIQDGSAWRLQVKVVLVRNEDDTFSPNADIMPFETDLVVTSVPGGHDDCWENPAPYLDIMESNL